MAVPRECGIKICLLLGLALLTIGVESTPSDGVRRGLVGETIFDVSKYGAKADGKSDNSQAFIDAWNAACKSTGSAKVVIPKGDFVAGEIVFQGPCTADKPITIEIQGNVLASTDISVYSSGIWIMLNEIDGLVVNGGGTINGRGKSSWKSGGGNDDGSLLPVSLVFEKVTNSEMHNLNFVDSMGFHLKVTDSDTITISNVKISAPGDSPNTDGIHMSSSSNVKFTDSVVGTGDDCVSIGHGTTNILISGITCGPGHGLSVGSLGKRPEEKDVQGISFINCTLIGTTNGARIKTYHASPSLQASGIIYKDIIVTDVQNPIIIDQHYNSNQNSEQSKVKISDVHFINIKGTTVSKIPVDINCSEAVPCEGVELADIDLTPSGSAGPLTSACSNAKCVLKGKPIPPGCE
ncbi:Exopolygalacturonase [Abeliophyllum distichum]|uniref:Exopolygalacturonase n=1 Tax=Abeliophyllum distichum TaxID=126358 RepID=A0ABD1RCI5_9LAMI